MARLIVTDPADRYLRDELKLSGWVQKPKERRDQYFSWCDKTLADLGAIMGGTEVPDDAVILSIRAALLVDDTFSGHVARKKGDYLTESDHWDRISRIAAGTIYHEYLLDVEKGRWP
jgi:hypothetical protein